MKRIILFVICSIVFSTAHSQKENYILDPYTTMKLITKLEYEPVVYKVVVKEVKNQSGVTKEKLFVGDLIASNSLSGSFIQMDNYVMMKRNNDEFLKHELALKDLVLKFKLSNKSYFSTTSQVLIRNIETDKYYYTEPYFLKRFDIQWEQKKQSRKLAIKNKRKMNVSRIDNMKYPLKEYSIMMNECKSLTIRLKGHRVISETGKMTKTQMLDWKRDIIEAKLLNYRIGELKESYEMKKYASYLNRTDTLSNSYDTFYEILNAANKYTGL
ncbi:hypothetical protein [uncultured Aquimarina sp.]|uniref:hypothetical protein n=1 Tax=uncultured Aquimarina sp. TaxID=575652 RepID=UPI00261B768C|nr:hypothetical protein [uncultured Aquimarina sp.]